MKNEDLPAMQEIGVRPPYVCQEPCGGVVDAGDWGGDVACGDGGRGGRGDDDMQSSPNLQLIESCGH